MAVSLQDANLVWQKVSKSLGNSGGVSRGPSSAAAAAFRGLKEYLAQQGGNPQLQFFPIDEDAADVAGGTVLLSGACKVYGVYVRKLNEGTANTVKLFDDATDDSTTTDQRISIILGAANQEGFQIYPSGFSLATGIVITQHTTVEGSTDGSSGGNGFIIVGAA